MEGGTAASPCSFALVTIAFGDHFGDLSELVTAQGRLLEQMQHQLQSQPPSRRHGSKMPMELARTARGREQARRRASDELSSLARPGR